MVARLHLARSTPDEGAEGHLPVRVVLAEDHALMRRSLRLVLEREERVQVIAEAGDLASAVQEVRRHHPDLLVLDRRLRGDYGMEAIEKFLARVPDTKVLILTMEDSPRFAAHAVSSGAIGCVLKDLADSELPQAIRAVERGEEYISPRLVGNRAG